MAVRIRLKKMGRAHRAFFRVCAFDQNSPRDGRAIEELGIYDPSVKDTDARAILNGERIAYWLGVGAQPTEKVAVLIKKYGQNGTHLDAQKEALARIAAPKSVPDPGKPASLPKKPEDAAPAEAAPTSEAQTSETPDSEAPATESAPAEVATEEAAAEAPAEQAAEATAEETKE